MDWNELYTRDNMPTLEQVGAYIGSPLWEELNRALVEDFGARPKFEHSRCSMPGWNVKYKKKGINLCTVYPYEHVFKALVIANERNQAGLEQLVDSGCEPIKELYRNTDYLNGGKWLFVDVDNESTLEEVMKLIEFRLI